MLSGPVPSILASPRCRLFPQIPEYRLADYFSAQLGAGKSDNRVKTGCDYLFEYHQSKCGWFSDNGTPSDFIHCLAGSLQVSD
ncbi:MAG: hypothetical protein QQM50_03150 [Dehalococcoides mccartyi]|uniref:hypothetical protein n=1 Tax=Dehalococcoides TaxID=61434 RepID=UPI00241D58D4|nr:hypothetical protein [Dehalococcoides mccartyi]MDP4279535.1 hypothetical protein [Dehalococcoides mccartyi]